MWMTFKCQVCIKSVASYFKLFSTVHFTQFNTVEPLPVEKKTKGKKPKNDELELNMNFLCQIKTLKKFFFPDQSTEQLAVGIICGTSAFAVIIIIIIVSLLLTSRRTKKSKIKAQTKDRGKMSYSTIF